MYISCTYGTPSSRQNRQNGKPYPYNTTNTPILINTPCIYQIPLLVHIYKKICMYLFPISIDKVYNIHFENGL